MQALVRDVEDRLKHFRSDLVSTVRKTLFDLHTNSGSRFKTAEFLKDWRKSYQFQRLCLKSFQFVRSILIDVDLLEGEANLELVSKEFGWWVWNEYTEV